MEESISKLSKLELIAMMLKIKNKLESSDSNLLRRYVNLMEVFNNLNLTKL